MRCRACEAPLEPHVFPGGIVRCACGADNAAPDPNAVPVALDPYRAPARPTAAAPTPSPVRSHRLGALCPRCTRLLRDDGEQAALACDRCRGVFVDHASLAARIEAERPRDTVAHAAPPAGAHGAEGDVHYVWCPHCRQVMVRMTFGKRSGIVVDVCHEHGTWFDAGELDGALAFVRAGGLEVELTEPLPAVDAEARVLHAELVVQLTRERQQQVRQVHELTHLLRRTGVAFAWRW